MHIAETIDHPVNLVMACNAAGYLYLGKPYEVDRKKYRYVGVSWGVIKG